MILLKTILVSIDAKFIHTNLAVRYLKANTTYPTKILEFTLKDEFNKILSEILFEVADIIGLSCYIWNIEIIKKLLLELRKKTNAIIILGGPEVSYEFEPFLTNQLADYCISGEGEIAFHQLLDDLHRQKKPQIDGVSYLLDNKQIISYPSKEIQKLNELKTPYQFKEDVIHLPNKIQYIETSRGCPFECSYCLASLENSVRYFDIGKVKQEISYLLSHGAKTFKFLDRTFNLYPKYAMEIFSYIFDIYHEGLSFQFEITGDILKQEIIDYVNQNAPKNAIRFEIGIQSTNGMTNIAVHRRQNNKRLFHNIRQLIDGNIVDLHLDLIAGLPYETLPIFKKTFQEVFTLYAKELQLGFLKLLKGTRLKEESEQYLYTYQKEAPYEMIDNEYLSTKDTTIIHQVEEILELYWNKGFMNQAFRYLTENQLSVFDLFYDIYQYLIQKHFNFHRYQLSEVFSNILDFVKSRNCIDTQTFEYLLKKDYLQYHPIKPKIWWDKTLNNRTELFREIAKKRGIRLDDLYKYAVVLPCQDSYFVKMYLPKDPYSFEYKKA